MWRLLDKCCSKGTLFGQSISQPRLWKGVRASESRPCLAAASRLLATSRRTSVEKYLHSFTHHPSHCGRNISNHNPASSCAFTVPFVACCLRFGRLGIAIILFRAVLNTLTSSTDAPTHLSWLPASPPLNSTPSSMQVWALGMSPAKEGAVANLLTDRQRRKNEALAQQIFSKNRRASAPGAGIASRKPGTGASLASRVGVTKVWGVQLR